MNINFRRIRYLTFLFFIQVSIILKSFIKLDVIGISCQRSFYCNSKPSHIMRKKNEFKPQLVTGLYQCTAVEK